MKLPFGLGQGVVNDVLNKLTQKKYTKEEIQKQMSVGSWESGTRFKYVGRECDVLGINPGHEGVIGFPAAKDSSLLMVIFDGYEKPSIVASYDLIEVESKPVV